MIHFDEPWLTVSWDEYCQAVRLEWKSYVEGEQARQGGDARAAAGHFARVAAVAPQ